MNVDAYMTELSDAAGPRRKQRSKTGGFLINELRAQGISPR